MPVPINHAATRTGAALLLLVMVGVAAMAIRGFRSGHHRWVYAGVGTYNVLLLSLYAAALLFDDGYGVLFLPSLVLTAPWSFLAMFLGVKTGVGSFFASGLIGNFILFVVLCGGANSFLLYTVLMRTMYSHREPIGEGLR
jgi:hypothetical protein